MTNKETLGIEIEIDLRRRKKNLRSSAVLITTGALGGPSPGLVKHKTVMWYSVYFWTPSTSAVCSASGSNGLGGTVTVFSNEEFSPVKKREKKKEQVNY